MIITEKVLIKVNNNCIKYFTNKGYKCNGNDIIEVKIEDVPNNSHIMIRTKCDICYNEKEISFRQYNKNINNGGYYCCSHKCSADKFRNTCLNKFGYKSPVESIEIKDKIKKTNIRKYGVEYVLQSQIIISKRKNTNLKKYGVENVLQIDKIKDDMRENNLKKYGVKNYSQTLECKNKIKNTCLKKYGVEYSSQSEEVKEKLKITRIKNGNQVPDELKTPFCLYRSKISNLTKLNIKKLFENWDGNDYYDKEYIKDNLNLKPSNKLYPTIDHKISVYYGFINNIKPEEIANLDNLCITKRSINSTKHSKTESEFICDAIDVCVLYMEMNL